MLLEMNRHADDEHLERYSMGTLPEAEMAGFEEHLLVCHECQDRLAEMDQYIRAMKDAAEAIPKHERGSQTGQLVNEEPAGWMERIWAWLPAPGRLGWAAGFASVLLVVAVAWQWQRAQLSQQPAIAHLEAARGSGPGDATVPAGTPLVLSIDITELAVFDHYRLQLVDAYGVQIWEAPASAQSGKILVATNKRLSAGNYFARVYAPSGQTLREFSLTVQ